MQQFNQKFFELLRTNIFDKPCRWENNLIFFRKSTNFGRFLDLKAFFYRKALSAANDRFLNSCGLKMGYIDVGDGCWRPNVLVTSLTSKVRHQHDVGNIKYQSPTSHSDVVWCWWSILVTQDSFIDSKNLHWIWHQVEFHVSNITYRSHSGILWCWWPIGRSPTCRKMSQRYFFCYQHLKMVTIIKSPT